MIKAVTYESFLIFISTEKYEAVDIIVNDTNTKW